MKNILTIAAISFCFFACNNRQVKSLVAISEAVQIDNIPGECPFLAKDNKGNTVLSWVRIVNDSTRALCYATSDDGKTFSKPVVVPGSGNVQVHGENPPKVIFKPSGEIVALWGAGNPNPKNKYSGLVYYTQSFDNGRSWTNAKPLVNDEASYDQRYYDVDLLPNGEVGIIWLDNRKTTTREGSALYFASTNGNNGFQGGRLIAEPCCQCCRTDLYVDRKGGIHALFRGIVQDSIRDMVHIVSTDGGKTFSAPKRINEDNWVVNGCPHTGPAMTENGDGIHFAWFTGGRNKGCYYTKTTDEGKTFQMHDSVSSLGSHPQLASLSNGELLIVWDEGGFAKGKMVKRIGIQRRTAEGKSEGKDFITPADSYASYPVIAPLNATSSIVAYTSMKEDKEYIAYQVVSNQ
ncbi:MAG TPA: sialidase family protein [Flavisolibacter sp.]